MFIWGMISWMALPWHDMVSNKFADEAAISQALKDNSPKRGVYRLPYSEKDYGPDKVDAFVNVLPHGTDVKMGKRMAFGLITQVISAFLVLCLFTKTKDLTYWGKVGFFSLVGLIIGFVSHAPYWNWFGFPAPYIIVTILDTWVGWALAGLTISKFTEEKM